MDKIIFECSLDTTYGFETSGHKLNIILYHNPATNRGEICQIAIMADECLESYQFIFEQFKNSFRTDPLVIIIDKVFIVFKQPYFYNCMLDSTSTCNLSLFASLFVIHTETISKPAGVWHTSQLKVLG